MSHTEDIQAEDIQAKGKQGKKFFISWLTRNLQKIKNEGLLSKSNLQKKLEKSENSSKRRKTMIKNFYIKKNPTTSRPLMKCSMIKKE